jgi:DNA-binding NtrC family response regulator
MSITAHSVLQRPLPYLSMLQRVLVVEPNPKIAANLLAAGHALGTMDHHVGFETARVSLTSRPFDFLVTNLRLSDFNGLHLVHLVSGGLRPPRCIVYTETRDPSLAREVQRSGAFYETAECLPISLSAYLRGRLPEADRRNPALIDRRASFRGGRRSWDEHVLQHQTV